MTQLPELCDRCNSWVITYNGKAVLETWNIDYAKQVADRDIDGVVIYTALDWLKKFSASIKC